MSSEYIAGTCNLGPQEIRSRQLVALFGGVLTTISALTLILTDQSKSARFSIFLPAVIFAIGFIQSRSKFCLAYGFAGTFNFGKLGQVSKVASAEDRRADRKTAGLIFVKSIALAAVITAVFYALPL